MPKPKYRHYALCSRALGYNPDLPLDPSCSTCQRWLKEPHQEAIEREKKRKEYEEILGP